MGNGPFAKALLDTMLRLREVRGFLSPPDLSKGNLHDYGRTLR